MAILAYSPRNAHPKGVNKALSSVRKARASRPAEEIPLDPPDINHFDLKRAHERALERAYGGDWYRHKSGDRRRHSFSDYLKAVKEKDDEIVAKVYGSGRSAVVKAAMGEESGPTGGYLLPTEFSYRLLETLAEESFIYPRASIHPMGARDMNIPTVDVTTVPAATGQSPIFGGVVFKWGSSQAPQETEPKFQALGMTAWDLLGYAITSNQWLRDTGPIGEEYLFRLFGKAAAWYAEYAFLQGTGSAQQMPLGIINAGATIKVARTVANQIAAADIASVGASLLPFSWKNAIWACSPTCIAQFAKGSTFQLTEYATDDTGCIGQLLTRPVYVTDKLPPMGTPGDMMLFDPTLYAIGDRMEVLIDISEHTAFITNQSVFRIWLRLDGKPMIPGVITTQDKTTTVSPYVMLR